jgi:hypothetical protein
MGKRIVLELNFAQINQEQEGGLLHILKLEIKSIVMWMSIVRSIVTTLLYSIVEGNN